MSHDDVDGLIQAIERGEGARVASILAAAPGLAHEANMFGARPIHAAHFGGHVLIVEALWRGGVEMDGFLAAELDDAPFLNRLIAADAAFVRARNAAGATALHGASYWGALDAARALIAAGADVRAQTKDGFLDIHPLGSAVATPNTPNPSDDETRVLALVDLLLDAGADVNARRRDGLTALHTAGYRGHLRVIKRLVERSADLSICGSDGAHAGVSAADLAREQKQDEAAELLDALARR